MRSTDRVIHHAAKDFPLLCPDETIREALHKFRQTGLPHKIIYFYVADKDRKLLGVLPTRLLLTTDLNKKVGEVYIHRVVFLRDSMTVEEARNLFAQHKFLAFPVVDEKGCVVGVIDIERFAGDLGNIHERTRYDDIYELLGLQASLESESSPLRAFRFRFPWLISTITAGCLGAFLVGAFESTLQNTLILAFFLTLVLGLNESVCMQSATLSMQRLHHHRKSPFLKTIGREGLTGLFLGSACGGVGGLVAWAWKGDVLGAAVIGVSLFGTMILSCLLGLLVPLVLKRFLGDPRVAAAPLALALSDLTTLGLYFGLGKYLLK